VGQCALENREIHLEQVPDNYIKITSGLGAASPKNILILPVKFNDQVLGVIELASLDEFSPSHKEFLHRVLNIMGITINRIANHMQVEKLLKESQIYTEELQTQSEELQLQQEELKTFNEKLEEQYKESKQKTVELEKAKLSLEEQARQLALSSQYKTDFLSNMSHELRTPLNSLLVLAQILAENSAGNLTAKQVEYAETIMSSGKDLLNLINDILDLSKVESGKMEVHPTEVPLNAIEDFAKRNFLPLAQTKKIDFSVQLADDLPEVIYTDEQRLRQILKNLLSNAFKFTEKGSVLLQIKKATMPATATPMLAISVTDTGIGIPEEKYNIIFEEFQQADGTTNRKYGGTGLGLSISKTIAELLGGFIRLESQEGKGSTFTLFIPLVAFDTMKEIIISEAAAGTEEELSDDINQPELDHPQGPLEGRKILIVDDDPRNVFALTALLENHKMDVLFAVDGKDGIKTLLENPDIDLVLMDIMLPEMDGYEAMRRIRQMPQYQALPIIALTAKAMKYDREKCINAGASDYISKPVNLKQLLSLIKVWLYK
ncbi:ATP-binding protein, partial [Sporotomaculum syntrophicum]|uniref:ATP-binding protein n=1 Tax=Sporotomaculum syntrophicum TaxID=182264 RepID=UPI0013799CEE